MNKIKFITTRLFVAAFLLCFSMTLQTQAAPGDLDPTFGIGGRVTSADFYGHAIVIQADGKIVVAGSGYEGTNGGFGVARYNPDGSPDLTFGTGGRVVTVFPNGSAFASAIVIQSDGKIVAAGGNFYYYYGDDPPNYDFLLARYNTDGSLDSTFGTGGKVITTLSNPNSGANDIEIQSDGKIVAVGGAGSGFTSDFLLIRYNTDGSLDNSFGTGGKVLNTFNSNASAIAVAIQSDGKIVATGYSNNGTILSFALARYNINGSLDTSFGTGGKVITSIGITNSRAYSVAIQSDGKIIAAGYSTDATTAIFTLVRYNADGSLDSTFGTGGIVITIFSNGSNGFAGDIAIQSDGKIVVAGRSVRRNNDGTISGGFALVRYNIGGTLDSTFGAGGIVVTTFSNEAWWAFYEAAVAIQTDGKIVVAGYIGPLSALLRYQAQAETPFDFDGDGKADLSVFRPSDGVWYLNQSTDGFSATQFGLSTDMITPADYDGDGKTDIAVYRDGTWYWLASSDNSYNTINFGLASDIPVPADYTGDGRAELAIYRNGTWWIQDLTNNQNQVVNFGLSTDKPIVADYDGDGRADQAVYRNGEWHLNRSTQGYAVVNFGLATDKPTVGDYDGDGKADEAVYRDGTWYVLQSSQGYAEFRWGIASDIPAPADYDGDGKTDAAVYRDGVWYLRQSTNGVSIQQFGLANDKPVPAAFLP